MSTVNFTRAATSASFETSTWQNEAVRPRAVMASATCRPSSSLKSATTTFAPASANRCAVASPMPWAAPVMMATLPSSTG